MENFRSALERHLQAIVDKDIKAFSEFLHPKHESVLILPKGVMVKGYDDILQWHTDWFNDPDWHMEINIMDAFCVEDMGYSLMSITYNDLDKDKVHYMMLYLLSIVLVKIDGKWILARNQNTMFK